MGWGEGMGGEWGGRRWMGSGHGGMVGEGMGERVHRETAGSHASSTPHSVSPATAGCADRMRKGMQGARDPLCTTLLQPHVEGSHRNSIATAQSTASTPDTWPTELTPSPSPSPSGSPTVMRKAVKVPADQGPSAVQGQPHVEGRQGTRRQGQSTAVRVACPTSGSPAVRVPPSGSPPSGSPPSGPRRQGPRQGRRQGRRPPPSGSPPPPSSSGK